MALLAGTVPWGAVTVKLESWRMELQTGRLERRIVDMLQRALAQAERGIRTWGK
jgi:hypothetical protein